MWVDHDFEMMGLALEQAAFAAREGEVPVGAVVADSSGRILSMGRNRREGLRNPLAHAEIEAISAAAAVRLAWRIEGVTLYVTLEPCPMCAGAIVNARIPRLVFGAADPKAGAVVTLYSLCSDPRLNHRVEVFGGMRREECAKVLTDFFADLRRK